MTDFVPNQDPQLHIGLQSELGYGGPERRHGAQPGLVRVLSCVLDEMDYGLVLLGANGDVIHANQGARIELAGEGASLHIEGRRLRCVRATDQLRLDAALEEAQSEGRRRLLHLGPGGATVLSIVPLPVALARHTSRHAVLITLQRPHIGAELSVSAYARTHHLSPREEEVLALLCKGRKAADIATELGVGAATVRTHIHNLKAKTGCSSMVELVSSVAVLPPIVGILGRA